MKYHRREVQFNDWELLKLFRCWDQITPEMKQGLLDRAQAAAFPPEQESASGDDDYMYDSDGYRFD